MKDSIATILRDKKTDMPSFREAAEKMAHILAVQAMNFVKEKDIAIETPISETSGKVPGQNVVLVPILRSGLAFLPVFLSYFKNAKVGFMGLKRDEKTFVPYEYYKNLPKVSDTDLVIVLDPMLATGGSSVATVKALLDSGIKEEQILCVFLISAKEGKDKLKNIYPSLRVIIAVEDERLNDKKYIVPGLGDFGDRYFGTE